ncbi:MAG: tol-pal system YbgF family protein, partial [Sedimentisphaerales bacterium]
VNAPNRPRDGNWLNDLNQLPITSYQLPITNHGQNLSIPSSQDAQQLWRSIISVAQSPPDKKYKDKLWRLIEQIRSIRFEPKNQAPEPVIVASPVPTVEPNETLSPAVTLAESAGGGEKQPQPEPDRIPAERGPSPLPYEPISNKTLQMLENLSQQPTQLYKAFELAEILFLSGNLKQAAMFYQHALNRKDPNDVTSAQDRAWILFQIGNCLIRSDLPAAKKMYRQLIIEYPNCPWTDLAKARENLIDWYLNDKPRALITECKFLLPASAGTNLPLQKQGQE